MRWWKVENALIWMASSLFRVLFTSIHSYSALFDAGLCTRVTFQLT